LIASGRAARPSGFGGPGSLTTHVSLPGRGDGRPLVTASVGAAERTDLPVDSETQPEQIRRCPSTVSATSGLLQRN